jgi:hypothetical protein
MVRYRPGPGVTGRRGPWLLLVSATKVNVDVVLAAVATETVDEPFPADQPHNTAATLNDFLH